jgi:hypothetical protein
MDWKYFFIGAAIGVAFGYWRGMATGAPKQNTFGG